MHDLFNHHDDDAEATEIPIPPPLAGLDFFVATNPEMDALERAAADGKHGLNYADLEQELARVHQTQGATHRVALTLTEAERAMGVDPKMLEKLTTAQDADAALVFLYISHLLAPPAPLPPRAYAGGWVDFDDVIAKIGWDPRSTAERREMHGRIYEFIIFGERAKVIGTRKGNYIDKSSGQKIPTTIEAAIWRIIKVERPAKSEKPGEAALVPLSGRKEAPVKIEMVMSREWAQLLSHPQTAQYLPLGELLGSIPGNKPSGAWARVIGLALVSFWRRQPRAALDGSIAPTRRELLERYPPKTGTVAEVLTPPNPQYGINYWCAALQILVESEFLAVEGEPQISPTQMRADLPRRNWSELWLNATVDLKPGAAFGQTIAQRVAALPPLKNKGARPPKKQD